MLIYNFNLVLKTEITLDPTNVSTFFKKCTFYGSTTKMLSLEPNMCYIYTLQCSQVIQSNIYSWLIPYSLSPFTDPPMAFYDDNHTLPIARKY